MNYATHPYADLLPMLSDEELAALADDIKVNGLREPIAITRSDPPMIVDGRNRLRACELAGVTPSYRTIEAEADEQILRLVISLNLRRRHLNASQKAVLGLRIEPEFARFAEERKRKAGERGKEGGRPPREPLANSLDKGSCVVSATGSTSTRRGARDYDRTRYVEPRNLGRAVGAAIAEPLSAPTPRDDAHATRAATQAAEVVGTNRQYILDAKTIQQHAPELLAKVAAGETTIPQALREIKKVEVRAKLADEKIIEAKATQGVYDVIVIDPPWPMEKIERDVRPNQAEFDYTTMTEAELAALEIPCADDAHVWVWTTHKFLPMAFRLLSAWGLKYVCTFVWHKPGGFQPIGLPQYNCEFALYARKGSPSFLDTKAFPTCFEAPRGAHSEKPEQFYDVVRRVTGGRRIDMFNRRQIEGFDGWGKETKA